MERDMFVEYIEKSIAENKTENRYVNGVRYLFISNPESDPEGWIDVVEVGSNGVYYPVIKAINEKYAMNYISMIEPISVPVEFI